MDRNLFSEEHALFINGQKTFISNGILCDLCIVAAKTDHHPDNAHHGISLFVVEAGTPGFIKGKKLAKMGMASQDTSELAFEDCRVPRRGRSRCGAPRRSRRRSRSAETTPSSIVASGSSMASRAMG